MLLELASRHSYIRGDDILLNNGPVISTSETDCFEDISCFIENQFPYKYISLTASAKWTS